VCALQQKESVHGRLFSEELDAHWVLTQRPARNSIQSNKPHGFFLEQERAGSGIVASSGVILLTNKECPWRCLICDLWKNTLPQRVPTGAIPAQIEYALTQFGSLPDQLKLYNSGSFFDAAAIPYCDYSAIAKRVSGIKHLIVESHPRLVGERALEFRDLLDGSFEVAMGLETTHPDVFSRLNKGFTLHHFESAAERLREAGIGVRAFVLVKPPFMKEEEGIKWAVRSAEFAFNCGADVVSLIPTRPGNGAMEKLMEAGLFSPPRLDSLERALERAIRLGRGRVFADTWNLEQFSLCSACVENRRQRLQAMNIQQQVLPAVACPKCGVL
jgi:radical SAM enzyme (TIGR01210 family)